MKRSPIRAAIRGRSGRAMAGPPCAPGSTRDYGYLPCVVEDDSECRAGAGGDGRDTMSQADSVVAVLAPVRTLARREDHERALRWAEYVGTALRTRSLL